MSLPSGLGPHRVGERVVVRRLVPGEQGPTGGPALTDVLGVLEAWGEATLTVRTAAGEAVVIERSLIVSGKPVPPRPSVHARFSADEVEHRLVAAWPAPRVRRLGDWVLRDAGGFSWRACSALVCGDPGAPVAQALDEVVAFYAAAGLPPLAQVVVGSSEEADLRTHGWTEPPGDEGEALVLLGGTARIARALGSWPRSEASVSVSAASSAAWLAGDPRVSEHADDALAVLTGPAFTRFGEVVGSDGALLAGARLASAGHSDDWAVLTDVRVDPAHRRQGLARALIRTLVAEAAEAGITTLAAQVVATNSAALALYDSLGFTPHHSYRFLTLPALDG